MGTSRCNTVKDEGPDPVIGSLALCRHELC